MSLLFVSRMFGFFSPFFLSTYINAVMVSRLQQMCEPDLANLIPRSLVVKYFECFDVPVRFNRILEACVLNITTRYDKPISAV